MKTCVHLVIPLSLTVLLAACEDMTDWDARRAISEETQRQVYADCAKRLNLSHWLNLHKLKSRDGLLHVLGSDGSGVTVAEARALNKCAWEKLDMLNASN